MVDDNWRMPRSLRRKRIRAPPIDCAMCSVNRRAWGTCAEFEAPSWAGADPFGISLSDQACSVDRREARERGPLPPQAVDDGALWLWGRLQDFERNGLLDRPLCIGPGSGHGIHRHGLQWASGPGSVRTPIAALAPHPGARTTPVMMT